MTCNCVEELLPSYRDGELGREERDRVEAHLRACPACASLLAFLGEADGVLASFPEVEVEAGLRERLAAVSAGKGRMSLFAWLRKPAFQPALAATALLGTALSLYFLNPGRREFEKEVVRSFHRGVGQVEKLYARAGYLAGSIESTAENLYASLRAVRPDGRDKD